MNSLQEIYTQVYKNLVMNSLQEIYTQVYCKTVYRKYIHKYIKTC